MSIPDHEIDYPDPCTDFMCFLCGDVKTVDDVDLAAFSQYEFPVCSKCWDEVESEGEPQEICRELDDCA